MGVYGRMIEGRQFQFLFPSEESLEVVLRSGPWAFSDRMLILERWTPSFNLLMLNFIPFWIQIRGIPIQFKSQDIVMHIGRALGMYLDVDYIPEVAARRDYARVHINWNVDEPLQFQRHFQFTAGVNTLLRFTFERLCCFCEVCGRLTHDLGACLVQNGNLNHDGDDEDSDGNNGGEHDVPNRGVIIEEIHEVEPNGDANVVQEENVQEKVEEEEDDLHEENANEYDELWSNQAMQTMYSDELNDEKMNNPINPFGTRRDGKELLKRKSWMESVEGNKLMFNRLERGESSGPKRSKRQKEECSDPDTSEASAEAKEDNTTVRGAVGPEPPKAP